VSAKKNKIKYGNYLCNVGYFDIRQKIVLSKKIKKSGKLVSTKGSVDIFVYHGKHQVAGPFKDKALAIEKANKLLSENFKYDKHRK
tara:strand:+ start:484 stop:741 length:258 start_codon:yes stop_codon:yes gene_type:complete